METTDNIIQIMKREIHRRGYLWQCSTEEGLTTITAAEVPGEIIAVYTIEPGEDDSHHISFDPDNRDDPYWELTRAILVALQDEPTAAVEELVFIGTLQEVEPETLRLTDYQVEELVFIGTLQEANDYIGNLTISPNGVCPTNFSQLHQGKRIHLTDMRPMTENELIENEVPKTAVNARTSYEVGFIDLTQLAQNEEATRTRVTITALTKACKEYAAFLKKKMIGGRVAFIAGEALETAADGERGGEPNPLGKLEQAVLVVIQELMDERASISNRIIAGRLLDRRIYNPTTGEAYTDVHISRQRSKLREHGYDV